MLMKAETEFGDLRLPHWTTLFLLTQIRSARPAAAAVNESATAVPLAAAGKKQPQVVGLQFGGTSQVCRVMVVIATSNNMPAERSFLRPVAGAGSVCLRSGSLGTPGYSVGFLRCLSTALDQGEEPAAPRVKPGADQF